MSVDTRTETRESLTVQDDSFGSLLGDGALRVGDEYMTTDGTGNSAKTGLTVSAFEARKWQPGQSGNPNGRPKSDREYKLALLKRFPPDELAGYWFKALQIAIRKEQAANMVKVLIPITEHLGGKPVATTVQVSTKYEQIMAAMNAMAGGTMDIAIDAIVGEITDSEAITRETQE